MSYEKLIPLDKSWIIRMGILDLVNGRTDIINFLDEQSQLGDDLEALKNVAKIWGGDEPVDVGESGTLYRLLQFASWKLGLNKKFIKRGTLNDRKINSDPSIVNLNTQQLLELDNGTSQWATAAVLLGNPERLPNPPYKLKLTYDAVADWHAKRQQGRMWSIRHDATIKAQADAFIQLSRGAGVVFKPEQAEDYCFARVFGFISKEEGELRWPSLKGHESNRIEEMETVIAQAEQGLPIESRDHRVVQAMAMWGAVNNKPITFTHPESVNKSWPQFWEFLKQSKNIQQ